ncbi:MAG TPA: hypothetical protein DHV03_01000 [Alphaproteobacteria bacterium]|nr:hypothetical protein [Paracoccaceae bacterium]MAW12920.1 hypothetical protein [Paracoccaceae bacterium]RCL78685.1 MAG: hypothetical protein DBW67_07005 [SAR116 cluster bacterium]HBQ22701.1 hypothetical protein [Alphaproteobacteria bacterium]HCY47234.1 hypothetical protein [Alphaproteobacteria bacterium]|tara:strand:- start:5449 stop:5724 length:276 start_codon:yes stop_codon:yes gene_type:complete
MTPKNKNLCFFALMLLVVLPLAACSEGPKAPDLREHVYPPTPDMDRTSLDTVTEDLKKARMNKRFRQRGDRAFTGQPAIGEESPAAEPKNQ